MSSAIGDDLSINTSYAAECVSILFDLFKQETTGDAATGNWHCEAMRAVQLAYKLIICSETLEAVGTLAKSTPKLSMHVSALISCLYLESSTLYPTLRSLADESLSKCEYASWEWLVSIEHQDWLRTHLACIEATARVVYLALNDDRRKDNTDYQAVMNLTRRRLLERVKLDNAVQRLGMACENYYLNLHTLSSYDAEPWKELPWKLLKPHDTAPSRRPESPVREWLRDLGRKYDRPNIDQALDEWLSEGLVKQLSKAPCPTRTTQPIAKSSERRRSSVRWNDEEGGKLERGSSILALDKQVNLKQTASSSAPKKYQATIEDGPDEEWAVVDEVITGQASVDHVDSRLPEKSKEISPESSLPEVASAPFSRLKLVTTEILYNCPYPACVHRQERAFKSRELLNDHLRDCQFNRDPEQRRGFDKITTEASNSPRLNTSGSGAIDIPARKPRAYSYTPASPQVRSPVLSSLNRSMHGPPGLHNVIELTTILEQDIKPAIYAFIRRNPRPALLSQQGPYPNPMCPPYETTANAEYQTLKHRLIHTIISPAECLDLGYDKHSLANKEKSRLVKEADRMVDVLHDWKGEPKVMIPGKERVSDGHTRSLGADEVTNLVVRNRQWEGGRQGAGNIRRREDILPKKAHGIDSVEPGRERRGTREDIFSIDRDAREGVGARRAFSMSPVRGGGWFGWSF